MVKLIKIDKNGTKYYEDDKCPRCGGVGSIDYYKYYCAGTCFACGGSGISVTKWKEYTPEYAEKLAAKRAAKEAKRIEDLKAHADDFNKGWCVENGFNFETKSTWLILGDTFAIKDELKSAGAKYAPQFGIGWHMATKPEAWNAVELSFDSVGKLDGVGHMTIDSDNPEACWQMVKELKTGKASGKHIGAVGDKITAAVVLDSKSTYENRFGYQHDLGLRLVFKTEDGDTLVWFTTSWPKVEIGQSYNLAAVVKSHDEFKGEAQTIIKNCKLS